MRRKHLLEKFLCIARIVYRYWYIDIGRYWYWTRLGYLQVMRGHRSWQELAEAIGCSRRRQKPVGLLSDPMGVSLLAGYGFDFGYGYGFGTAIKADRV